MEIELTACIFIKDYMENIKIEINFSDFTLLLYKINFTIKNYFELMQKKENNPDEEEEFRLSIKTLFSSKQKKFEYDIEYKLLIDD